MSAGRLEFDTWIDGGGAAARSTFLGTGNVTVGRSPGSHLLIPEHLVTVSGDHLSFVCLDSAWWVANHGRHGTRLGRANGDTPVPLIRIDPEHDAPLRSDMHEVRAGDELELAGGLVVLTIVAAVAPTIAANPVAPTAELPDPRIAGLPDNLRRVLAALRREFLVLRRVPTNAEVGVRAGYSARTTENYIGDLNRLLEPHLAERHPGVRTTDEKRYALCELSVEFTELATYPFPESPIAAG